VLDFHESYANLSLHRFHFLKQTARLPVSRVALSPTIRDIAQHAGVSSATVSRVINKTAPVNAETEARVQAAILALGYAVRPSEPRPERRPPGTIALLITDLLNPFFSDIVRGIEDEADPANLGLLLYNLSEDTRRERRALAQIAERSVEGVIACASRVAVPDLIQLYEQHRIPLVVINRRLSHPAIPAVLIDFAQAAYRAAQHVLQLGHRQIAYLGGNPVAESSLARRSGVVRALVERGLELPDIWCPTSFPNIVGGFQAVSALFARPCSERPTAVIGYNDLMALGALQAARAHGLHVPDDLSVVGFDGIEMAAHAHPPLTTIEQPRYRLGQLAMQLLREQIAGRPLPAHSYTLLESPLIVRESTAPPRGGNR
jgi:DNA-binding LacI/PurR family transcriptional regulator